MKLSLRAALVLAATGLVLTALPSSAAQAPVTLMDQTGDANALNDQGRSTPAPEGTAGPSSQPQYDIKSLTFASLGKGKACKGYTITLELAAPAATSNVLYRVRAVGPVNSGFFFVEYANGPVLGASHSIRHSTGATSDETTGLSKPAVLVGNKIIWTVLLKDLKATGEKTVGTVFSALGMQVRGNTDALLVPVWDQIPAGDKTFAVCG